MSFFYDSFIAEFVGFLRIFILLSFLVSFVLFVLYADADITLLFYHYLNRPRDFNNKVVWITGASSGIGEHLSYSLVKLGAKLALSGVNIERLEAVGARCKEISNCAEESILLVPFQINNFEIHDECVRKVLDHFGEIDILVSNAGIYQTSKFVDTDTAFDKQIFDVNVFGPINLSRKVLGYFLEQRKGHFVTTSSICGKIGLPCCSTHSGSKHALHGYFESLRSEMVNENIDVTLVCPGPVLSRISDRDINGEIKEKCDYNQDISQRMPTEQCSDLMATAIAYKLDECWISLKPFLLFLYVEQYFPSRLKKVVRNVFYQL